MNKKVLLLTGLALLLVACSPKYKEGTYQGEATGYNKDKKIKIEVTVDKESKISDVKILEQEETEELGAKALDILSKRAVEVNKAKVDTVAGATITSNAFNEAMDNALNSKK